MKFLKIEYSMRDNRAVVTEHTGIRGRQVRQHREINVPKHMPPTSAVKGLVDVFALRGHTVELSPDGHVCWVTNRQ